ncbi:MAG: aminotransferase class I/II-fold pyridoxal phosphate-dependent enzyme, partial [Actinomycetota bacterium]
RPSTSAELASLILEEAEVAVVPGEAFGPSGYVRLSYATSDEDIIEGVTRIKNLLAEAK